MSKYVTDPRKARRPLRAERHLRDVVPTLPSGVGFDLGVFGLWHGKLDDWEPVAAPETIEDAALCGFTGCVAGHLALVPYFRDLGIGAVLEDSGVDEYELLSEVFGITTDAAMCVFGQSRNDWSGGPLYDADLDPYDPIVAADRIRRFCKSEGIAA